MNHENLIYQAILGEQYISWVLKKFQIRLLQQLSYNKTNKFKNHVFMGFQLMKQTIFLKENY